MTLPTIAHLETIGLASLANSHPFWEWCWRKPWGLAYPTHEGIKGLVRQPPCRISPVGLPYTFSNAKAAFEFRDSCIAKLKRAAARSKQPTVS